MRILFINQFVPPDEAPTSRLLAELGEGLRNLGWETEYLGSGQRYRGKALRGWRRWLRDLRTHLRVLICGLWVKKPDVILCLTDPPALVFTAALISMVRGSKLVHWAMDIYPEIAAALGELKSSSPIYTAVSKAASFGYSRCALIGCLDADMAIALGIENDPRRHDCAPWPPMDLAVPESVSATKSDRIQILYSGNLGRAHDYETLLRAQRILEDADAGFDLVFQGGGPNRERSIQLATELGLRHCHWLDYAADEEFVCSLMKADVLAATQRPETQGLLWPSKLALMQLLPKAVLWVGPENGAISDLLRTRNSPSGIFAPGGSQALADWLLLHKAELAKASPVSFVGSDLKTELRSVRNRQIQQWNDRLMALIGQR